MKINNETKVGILTIVALAMLILGFISHEEEEKYINSDQGQDEMVEDLVNAFRTYKQRVESRSINTTP